MTEINTHNLIVDFGKHRGERWTRLPLSYLRWLVNEVKGEKAEIAKAELARRGTAMPTDLELSGHALDRASQITREWEKEGVYSWLVRVGEEARVKAAGAEEVLHAGFKFVFIHGEYYPVLKTIMKKGV